MAFSRVFFVIWPPPSQDRWSQREGGGGRGEGRGEGRGGGEGGGEGGRVSSLKTIQQKYMYIHVHNNRAL